MRLGKRQEKTLFLDFVGISSKSKFWDTLLTWVGFDFTKNDVVNVSGINRQNGYKIVKWLIKNKYIIKSGRKYRGRGMYKLNIKDRKIIALKRLFNECLKDGFKYIK